MFRLLALLCLLGSVGALWLGANESGRVIEGYSLIAALGIMAGVVCIGLHIYAEKHTIPQDGKEFVESFLTNLGVSSLTQARKLIAGAVQADTDAKASRKQAGESDAATRKVRRELQEAQGATKRLQAKLDKLQPELEGLRQAEKERAAAVKTEARTEKTATQELETVRGKLTTAEAEVLRLTGEVGLLRVTADRVPGLEADLTSALEGKSTAELARNTANTRVEELTGQLQRLEAQLRAAEDEPKPDPEQIVTLTGAKEEAERQLSTARAELDTEKQRVVELSGWKSENEPKLVTLAETQRKLATALVDLGKAEQARDDAKSIAAGLQKQIETATSEKGSASADAERLQGLLDTKTRELTNKEGEFATKLREATDALTEALGEIERLRANPPGLSEAILTIAARDEQLRILKEAHATLEKQIETMTTASTNAAEELRSVNERLTNAITELGVAKKELLRIPELEKRAGEAVRLRSELEMIQIGDRELEGVTLKALREARDCVVAALDMEELAVRQINFAVVYAMALDPGPELTALGLKTKELVDYITRAYDDVLEINPDRLRSLLQKKGVIPAAAWNRHIRLQRQRARLAEQKKS